MTISHANPDDWERYQRERDRLRARAARIAAGGREIPPIPPVKDPARKAKALKSLEYFGRTYMEETFCLPPSNDQREVIRLLEQTAKGGGLFAFCMPRGSGKSSWCEAGAMWSNLGGFRTYVALIGADKEAAEGTLLSIWTELTTNDELAADFPEVCHPLRALEGIANRCRGQRHEGRPTHIKWKADTLVLPTIPGSPASAAILQARGLLGRIRGMKFKRPDNSTSRPDQVILDDPQTDTSARSEKQNEKRLAILRSAILGLAGPGKQIAGVMPCTVIQRGDMVDEILDRQKNPEWRGKRTKLVYRWPDRQDLWDQYLEIRAQEIGAMSPQDLEEGDGPCNCPRATEFYRQHRKEMDEGAEVQWEARKLEWELSALQHAYDLKAHLGDEAFASEMQGEPDEEPGAEAAKLTRADIDNARTSLKRGEVPAQAEALVGYIDVQLRNLPYGLAAVTGKFDGWLFDFGAYPDPQRHYWSRRDPGPTIQKLYPGLSFEAALYKALDDFTTRLFEQSYQRMDGAQMRLSLVIIDANWGRSTKTVYRFIQESRFRALLLPGHGQYKGARSIPWEQYEEREGETLGDHWRIPPTLRRGSQRLLYDSNYWKTWLVGRLTTPTGDPGAWRLPTTRRHRLLRDHLLAEEPTAVTVHGRTVDEWELKSNEPDNDGLDVLAGLNVAASKIGCKLPHAPAKPPAPKRKKGRVSYF